MGARVGARVGFLVGTLVGVLVGALVGVLVGLQTNRNGERSSLTMGQLINSTYAAALTNKSEVLHRRAITAMKITNKFIPKTRTQ